LVQGPPGTGKSHTIANLICHLLATGQRVLVTAKTPRALQILEHKLPPSIRPLCISLLGKASQDRNSLEQSVGGILRENQEWDESRAGLEMSLLEQQLQALRSRQSELQRMLRDIRESETHTQTIASGGYTGTAAHIAKQVNNDRSVYEWFKDETTPEAKLPVTSEILHQVLSALRHFTQEKRKELSLHRADWTLDSSGFALLVSAEKEALEEERKIWPDAHEQVAEALLQREAKEVVELEQLIADFAACRRSLSTSPYRWMSEAIKDVLASNGTVWQALRYATANCVETFTPIAATVEETTIDAPPDLRPEDLQKGAERVSAHLASGGKLGWGPFRPKAVKHLSHVIKGTKVNGNPCRSAADFATLAHALKVRVGVERTWQLWLGRCEPIRGPLPLQIASLSALREALDKVLPMGTKLSFCREKLRLFPSLLEPDWDDPTSLDKLVASCRLAMVRRRRIAVQSELKANASSAELAASDPRAHPLNKRLLEAISCREVDTYRAVHTEFAALAKEESGQLWLDGWMRYLHAELPFLAKSLDATAREPFWTERINGLDKAWKWAQAKRWVEEYIISQDVASLDQSIKRIEGEILETMERLAARRAWSHCFERMKEPHRRHMEQWRLSMVDVGQGTGPQASNYLKDARVSLDLCREAVPAWVMPLHRVWDTMKPSANMFDVVIVDEASQCGSEGLPLLFLAAKTLVVGDDKQISPEHVGIQPNEVRQLIAHFLPDFVLKSSFNIKRSLFDQAKIRYGTSRIVLREHFRCMPEIIRFSNDLCYSNTPLIPLRQYGSSRLPPTTHFFVGGGYREGEGNRVFNRPEAEAIVNKIAEMCADSRYDGKSVGVVVLQGEAQGMLIEKLLLDRIGAAEIEKRRLVCGNPYTFQGDERHIVLLSMVAAPNARMRPFSSTADERRFNVAASRAQDMMILFHSVQVEDLSRSCLRRRLLEFFQGTQQPAVAGLTRDELEFRAAKDNRAIVDPPKPFDSWFEVDVSLELLRRNYIVRAQHAVADKFINLVVEGGKARLAVECDGDHWHGPDRYEADMERQRRLERCGWAFFRVRESAFYTNTEEALRGLWDALELHGIRPVSSWQPKEAEFQEESREAVAADSSEIFEPAPGA
jgi:very-short-patch-repair endonuclease